MGYRTRLGRVSKVDHAKYHAMTEEEFYKKFDKWDEELEDWEYNFSPYRPPFHTELYEIGKYVDFSGDSVHFYPNMEDFEAEFKIMTKEKLAEVIQSYATDVADHYKDMLNRVRSPKYDSTSDVDEHFREKAQHWEQKYVPMFYLDEEHHDGNITPSWSKEYAIFNMVEIYRNFDWENDLLIYSGW